MLANSGRAALPSPSGPDGQAALEKMAAASLFWNSVLSSNGPGLSRRSGRFQTNGKKVI